MCRLLAHVCPRPTTFAQLLGQEQTELFRVMARLHDDGWGAMWVPDHPRGPFVPADGDRLKALPGQPRPGGSRRQVERIRVAGSGHDDGALADILQRSRQRVMVAHLRLATRSMGLAVRNTHPFLADGLGMAHNGAIVPTDRLRDLLDPAVASGVAGQTDSELYFALIRQQARNGATLAEAAARAVATIRVDYPRPSLNAMLLSPSQLVVVHSSSQAPVPYEDFTASAMADNLPMHHDEAYFRMSFRRFPDGSLAFTSAGLDTSDWQALPQDSITRVDLQTLEMTTESMCAVRH